MIEFHRLILGDTIRNDAFVKALKQVIVPGKTVIADIGSGTGFLSFVASRLGAKECHLYEFADLLPLSRKIADANGIKNCYFYHKHSTEVRQPVKADVVLSETLGNYALEENILETLRDARRFLKPGGVMIPQKLWQYVCPVINDRLYRELNVWDELRHSHTIDFAPAKEMCFQNMYVKTIPPGELLKSSEAVQQWDTIDFREENNSIRKADTAWKVSQEQTIFGFALWWDCELLPGITLSTNPAKPKTHWEQIFLPLPEPVMMPKDGGIRLHLHSDTQYEVKVRVKWEVEVRNGSGKVVAKMRGDTRRG